MTSPTLPPAIVLNQLRVVNTVALTIDIPDLEAFIREVDHTETFTPFFDPTAALQPGFFSNLQALREVATSFLAYRRALEPFAKELRTPNDYSTERRRAISGGIGTSDLPTERKVRRSKTPKSPE